MKLHQAYLYIFVVVFSSCSINQEDDAFQILNNNDKSTHADNNIAIRDSTKKVFTYLNYDKKRDTYIILWGNNQFKDSTDFNAMIMGRDYRLPPRFSFSNDSYICITTYWFGPFSEHLFLPLKTELNYKFIKEDIEWIDSINNTVCYIHPDKTTSLKTYWTLENLISGYKKEFEVPIYKNAIGHPWYSKIVEKNNYLEITPQGDDVSKVIIDIKSFAK